VQPNKVYDTSCRFGSTVHVKGSEEDVRMVGDVVRRNPIQRVPVLALSDSWKSQVSPPPGLKLYLLQLYAQGRLHGQLCVLIGR
jgi:hypothetical protein